MKRIYKEHRITKESTKKMKELSTFERFLEINRLSNTIPYIEGEKGIGKSDRIRQYANKMDFEFISLEFSNIDRVEFMGLMDMVEYQKGSGNTKLDNLLNNMGTDTFNYHKHTVPSWVKQVFENDLNGKATVLLFDELNRSSTDVASALMNTILERKYGSEGLELPESTYIIAAGNPDKDDYIVNSLDHALNGRMIKYVLETSFEDWKNNFAINSNIHSIILEYLYQNNDNFYQSGEMNSETGEKHPGSDPRRWEMLSNNIRTFEKLYGNQKEEYLIDLKNIVFATLGIQMGSNFFEFYKNTKKITLKQLEEDIKKDIKEGLSSLEISEKTLQRSDFNSLENLTKSEFLDGAINHYRTKQINSQVLSIIISVMEVEHLAKIVDVTTIEYKDINDVIDKYDSDNPKGTKTKLSFYNKLVDVSTSTLNDNSF